MAITAVAQPLLGDESGLFQIDFVLEIAQGVVADAALVAETNRSLSFDVEQFGRKIDKLIVEIQLRSGGSAVGLLITDGGKAVAIVAGQIVVDLGGFRFTSWPRSCNVVERRPQDGSTGFFLFDVMLRNISHSQRSD